ncbi:hypothetical protein AB4Z50_14700 [Paenibacillus sp. 2TAB26]|uniref:hypothetical protein n=1 Tax=Paenibacillus sp. 2TAB26 TaxID=3233005 RepID=UPI003F954ED0
MEKLPLIVVVSIIVVGICFWIFNNPNGINDGLSDGAGRINTKTSTFDYSGSVAPGAGHSMP